MVFVYDQTVLSPNEYKTNINRKKEGNKFDIYINVTIYIEILSYVNGICILKDSRYRKKNIYIKMLGFKRLM